MALTNVWLAGYGGPAVGATAVWIAPNDGTVPSATQVTLVGWNGPVSGATPIWIAAYGGPPPAAIGAIPICISGWSGAVLVIPGSPVNTVAPAVTGTALVGSTLTCSTGTWTNSPTGYTYQWTRNGGNISGATSSTYLTVTADGGTSVGCVVRATNAISSNSASSNVLAILGVPANTAAPVASGSLTVGSTLSCTQGTWTNSPTSYAYQWQRGGANISGATSSSYVTVSADGGTSVGCLVTATNAAGSASQASNTLAIAASGATSVWSASDAATNGMTLSNGGLTVTPLSSNGWVSIRNSISKTSGKLYAEFSVDASYAGSRGIFGLASTGFNAAIYIGASDYSGGTEPNNFQYVSTGFTNNYAFTYPNIAASTTYSIAVDFASGNMWFGTNGVWDNDFGGVGVPGNPSTGFLPVISFVPGTVGALFLALSFYTISGNSGNWTLQPTAASLKYLPPPGFQAWDGGPVTPSTSVWSAADASANGMTLSNGGLTVTPSGVASWQSIRGTISKSTGQLYVEFINSVNTTDLLGAGTANAAFVSTSYLGSSASSYGGYTNGTNYGTNFTPINGLNVSSPQSGDVIGVAIDFNAGMVWLAENNAWISGGNPATGASPSATFTPATVGALFPAIVFNGAGAGVWTLQATAASQKYAPPSGFSAWDGGAPVHSPQALAYLARTVGGNEGGNGTNIANLIDGLVSDGVWAKLDALYVLAQQNQTDAQLNLIGTSYSLVQSPGRLGVQPRDVAFTSYVGFGPFVGVNLNTGFDPTSAPSPHYTQNNASYGFWAYAVSGSDAYPLMGQSTHDETAIYNNFGDGNFYGRLNGVSGGVPSTITKGVFAVDRPDASNVYPYQNGVSAGAIAFASVAMGPNSFKVGGAPSAPSGSSQTLSAAFIGASLGSAGQLALYNRLRTYMTAVGVP